MPTNSLLDPMPFTLSLDGLRVLLVGGDLAAANFLLRQGALLHVVNAAPDAGTLALAAEGRLRLDRRAFDPADLDGVRLCVGAPGPAHAAAAAQGIMVGALPAASRRIGRAVLVGAGPGAAGLLTVRAVEAIRDADVVMYDKLIGPEVLALIRPGAQRIDVGKRCGRHAMAQSAINALIVRHAQAGRHVVRLKGGDPFVFGRGGEELESLRAAGVATEVVPGITAALAAAARLGIPLTHRGASRSLHLITAHGSDDRLPEHDWTALARAGGTLAVYMGVRTLPLLTARLLAAGMAPGTPAIAVENATLARERRMPGTLAGIADAVAAAGLDGPTLVLIGAVVAMADVEADAAAIEDDLAA
jgi:uroporphyrin-III C-methyltransferase